MARGVKRRLRSALRAVQKEIARNAAGSKFASGLASEGYAGGYRDALSAVLLLLDGVEPSDPRRYWRDKGEGL